MENKTVDTYEELLDYLTEQLEENDDICLLVNYDLAVFFSGIYDIDDFTDYFGIDLQSDVGEYIVTKIKDEFFNIEPARHNGHYSEVEVDKLIILKDKLEDELIEVVDCGNIEIVSYENDSDDEYTYCDCENCHGCDEGTEDIDDEDIEEIEDDEEINCDECLFDNLSEAHQEYIDEHIDVLLKYGISECETRNLLAEIVQTMYLDGEKDCLLNWSKIFKELVENDGEE